MRERLDGGGIEEIHREFELRVDPRRCRTFPGTGTGEAFGDRDRQVEFGHLGIQRTRRGKQPGQFEADVSGGGEGQRHLEQRMPRLRAGRIQGLDELFEGDIGVREGGEIGVANPVREFAETLRAVDFGAQRQRVDEHADQVVEFARAAAADGGADHDVGFAGEPREQHGQGSVHQHEGRNALGAGGFRNTRVQLGGQLDAQLGAAAGGDHGARAVGGQGEQVRRARQGLPPEAQLPRQQRVGGVGRAEAVALPQRVIDVLHREGLPGRGLALDAGQIGQDQVAGQDRQRQAVGGDVVQHDGDGVLGHVQVGRIHHDRTAQSAIRGDGTGDGEQSCTERDLTLQVETAARELAQPRVQFVGIAGVVRHRLGRGRHRQHLLARETRRGRGEYGAQHLVPIQHVGQRVAHGGLVRRAAQSHHERHVVSGAAGVETVQEPDALLRRGQRQRLRALAPHQRDRAVGLRVRVQEARVDHRGQLGHAGGAEHLAHRQGAAQFRVQARGHLGGDQAVAAQGEEVVEPADLGHIQHLAEDPGHGPLGHRLRGLVPHRYPHRRGQRGPIQLAGSIERQGIQRHVDTRHHVRGQRPRRRGLEPGRVDLGGLDHVGDQLLVAHHDHRAGHALHGGQHRLDLAELDAQAAHLHLEIGAAQVLDLTVLVPVHEIAGAVHERAGFPRVGVGDEAFGGQARP
ncbi:hypothetical protein NSERKGN1266_73870 [Nocardia seriolae]|nr:hypothetical protein NSERKGN1266_73870 [Nocardia seriolae]